MNIEQAKAIPLPLILKKMDISPAKPEQNKQLWYLAPWRAEKTASLHVHTDKNIWYDLGEGNYNKLRHDLTNWSGNSKRLNRTKDKRLVIKITLLKNW